MAELPFLFTQTLLWPLWIIPSFHPWCPDLPPFLPRAAHTTSYLCCTWPSFQVCANASCLNALGLHHWQLRGHPHIRSLQGLTSSTRCHLSQTPAGLLSSRLYQSLNHKHGIASSGLYVCLCCSWAKHSMNDGVSVLLQPEFFHFLFWDVNQDIPSPLIQHSVAQSPHQ